MLHLAPANITSNGTTAIIFVQGCQGSERTFCHWSAWNWMSLLQYIAIKALQQLLQLHKGAKTKPFWGESRRSFLETWRNIAAHLQLPHGLYQPYSLRRGGATSAYQNGMSLYTCHQRQMAAFAHSQDPPGQWSSGVSCREAPFPVPSPHSSCHRIFLICEPVKGAWKEGYVFPHWRSLKRILFGVGFSWHLTACCRGHGLQGKSVAVGAASGWECMMDP